MCTVQASGNRGFTQEVHINPVPPHPLLPGGGGQGPAAPLHRVKEPLPLIDRDCSCAQRYTRKGERAVESYSSGESKGFEMDSLQLTNQQIVA